MLLLVYFHMVISKIKISGCLKVISHFQGNGNVTYLILLINNISHKQLYYSIIKSSLSL